MASLIIEGRPIASFEFEDLPSWNDVIDAARGRGHWSGSKHTKEWRSVGEEMARGWNEWAHVTLPREFLVNKAMVVVTAMRVSHTIFDVHNIYVKAVFDGFTDAMIWRDDNYRHLPWVLFGYREQDEVESALQGRHFKIDVYPLSQVVIDGVDCTPRQWVTKYGKG